jgi:L-histidine Nalpha-methyltransferase
MMQLNTTLLPMIELSRKQDGSLDTAIFAQDVAKGLSKNPKTLPSRYFYDGIGSRLFQQIMDLPEYYLTRCEFGVLTQNKESMAAQFSAEGFFHLIDLGAGDALKTKILLRELSAESKAFDYVPVDISGDAMKQLTESLHTELPAVDVQAVVGEYFKALEWLQENKAERKVVLFLGSNIGNFDPDESESFLISIRSYLQPGDKLLMGIDLRKDPNTIIPAYDDASGVTAAFNLNLLLRINTELGANFDINNFRHFAMYEPQEGAMKSYLISEKKQTVFLQETGQTFEIDAWEAIHTENSYKYSVKQIEALGNKCGFKLESVFEEENKYFADVLFSVQEA